MTISQLLTPPSHLLTPQRTEVSKISSPMPTQAVAWQWLWDKGKTQLPSSQATSTTHHQLQQRYNQIYTQQQTLLGNNLTTTDAEHFGDPLLTKPHNTLRVGFHNIHFLPFQAQHHKNYDLLTYIKSKDFDIYMFTEVGLNWSKVAPHNQWVE